MTLIVQNQFPAMVGTATSANNYFRQMGASLGAAIVGSLFASNLSGLLAERLPAAVSGDGVNSLTPTLVRSLPDSAQQVIIGSYNDALTPVFLLMVPLVLLACALLLFIRQKPLATTVGADMEASVSGIGLPVARHRR